MEIVKIKLSEIIPYEKNVKRHSEQQIEKLAKNIEEYWFIQPIVIDENNTIVIGHWRYEAMKFLKKTDCDCVILKWFSETKLKALRIADNKLNESPFDFSNLKTEMEDILKDGWVDLEDLWFSLFELEELQLSIKKWIEDGERDIDDEEENIDKAISEVEEWTAYDFKNVQWTQNQKTPMTFFLDKDQLQKLTPIFATNRKWEFNVEKLLEVVDFYLENN